MPPDKPSRPPPKRRPKRCPICGRPAAPETHPFCSERCREVDLGRWLSGTYVIPARDGEDDGEVD